MPRGMGPHTRDKLTTATIADRPSETKRPVMTRLGPPPADDRPSAFALGSITGLRPSPIVITYISATLS